MLAQALVKVAPDSLQFEFVEIGDLPLYNDDLDSDAPATWTSFREKVKSAQAILFVTPEYNRSMPGVLKNAIDVGSRPYGHSVWGKKPSMVVSQSIGPISGFGANHHLRQSLVYLDAFVMAQPEMYIANSSNLFDDEGRLANESSQKFFASAMQSFADWVEKVGS